MKRKFIGLLVVCMLLAAGAFPLYAQESSQEFTGTIDNERPFTEYPLQVTQRGLDAVIDLRPTDDTSDLDTLLYLIDNQSRIIASNDDRADNDLSSLIRFPEIAPGNYTIIATRYAGETGTTSGEYTLSIELAESTPLEYNFDVSPEALANTGFPEMPEREKKEWTIIAYYGGDTTLEESIINDVNEFELAGGSNDDINVVVLLDRHPEYSRISGDWRSARLFEISDNQTVEDVVIDSPPLVDFGLTDTGSGEFFAQYLTWVTKNYPAERYAVALASHGAAWQGIIVDETGPAENIITLPELTSAFRLAKEASGIDKFDILVNDACLMASIEYHDAMSEFFDVSYASPEIVTGSALDMTLLLQNLKEGEDNLVSLGTELIDKYISVDSSTRESADSIYLTHAVTDLTRFAELREAINAFTEVYASNPVGYSETIGKARANTYTYTAFAGEQELIDLGSFMTQVEAESRVSERDLRLAANEVRRALSEVVLYGQAGERASTRTTYQNIYFPLDGNRFDSSYFDETDLISWAQLLRTYFNVVTPDPWTGGETVAFHSIASPRVAIADVYPTTAVSVENPLSTVIEVVGSNLSSGEGTVDLIQPDGTRVRYLSQRIVEAVTTDANTLEFVNNWDAGYNRPEITWDVTLPVVSDGINAYRELLLVTGEDNIAALDGRYREPESETWNNVTIVFDLDGNFQRVINRSGNNALGVIDIPAGSDFETFKSVVSSDGRTSQEPGNRYTWPPGGLTWQWEPAPSGEYAIGLVIQTFGGTTGFQALNVTVDNSAVNPNVRAASLQDVGVVLPRPAAWEQPSGFTQEDTGAVGLRSFDESGSGHISLYIYADEPLEELEELVNRLADAYQFDAEPIYTPTSVDGTPGLAFNYSYDSPAGRYSGRAISFFQPTTGIGVAVGAAASDSSLDVDELFTFVERYLRLIPTDDMMTPSYNWEIFYGASYEFAQPLNWQPSAEDMEGWLTFTNPETANSFFAVQEAESTEDVDAAALNEALLDTVESEIENFELLESRTYNASVAWNASTYSGVRDGVEVIGRVYTAAGTAYSYDLDDVRYFTYKVWMEAPADDSSINLYRYVFEPVLDSFLIYFE